MTDIDYEAHRPALQACPSVLCNSKNSMLWCTDKRRLLVEWSIMCRDCGASLPSKCKTEAEAIAAWNTRAAMPKPDALERAREIEERIVLNLASQAERQNITLKQDFDSGLYDVGQMVDVWELAQALASIDKGDGE